MQATGHAATVHSGGPAAALDRLAYAGLCTFVFLIPWGDSLPLVAGWPAANWIGLMVLGTAVCRAALLGGIRELHSIVSLLAAFVLWAALSVLWTVDHESTMERVATFLQLLVLAWLIWEFAVTRTRVRKLILSFVLGGLVSSLTTVYNYLTGRTYFDLAATSGRENWETYRYSVRGINPDELALIAALSIPMALYLLVTGKRKWPRALCWLQMIAGIIAILLSATRGALVALVAGLAVMSVLTVRRMSLGRCLAALSGCAGVAVGAFLLVPQSSWNRFLTTGTELTQGTLTHRTVLWSAGMDVFRDHVLLGVGSGAYAPAILSIVDMPLFAHNTFISVLVELGVVGALLFLALLASLFYYALRLRGMDRNLWLALLTTWTVGVSLVTWEHRKTTWLLFGLLAAHTCARAVGAVRAARARRVAPARLLPAANAQAPRPWAGSHPLGAFPAPRAGREPTHASLTSEPTYARQPKGGGI